MAKETKNLVKDQTQSVGTADYVIDGVAPQNYFTVAASHANGAKVGFVCLDSLGNIEVGKGTWNSGTSTVSRDTIIRSTNANAKVVWGSGPKTFYTGPLAEDYFDVTVAMAASDIDLSAGYHFTKTITTTTTLTISQVPASGNYASFYLTLTNGGSQTVNLPSGAKWGAGAPPTLTAAGKDILTAFTVDGGTTWYWSVYALDIK